MNSAAVKKHSLKNLLCSDTFCNFVELEYELRDEVLKILREKVEALTIDDLTKIMEE